MLRLLYVLLLDILSKLKFTGQSKGIAGRHLKRLTLLSDSELSKYGLLLGDLLDLVDIVQTTVQNKSTSDDSFKQGPSTSQSSPGLSLCSSANQIQNDKPSTSRSSQGPLLSCTDIQRPENVPSTSQSSQAGLFCPTEIHEQFSWEYTDFDDSEVDRSEVFMNFDDKENEPIHDAHGSAEGCIDKSRKNSKHTDKSKDGDFHLSDNDIISEDDEVIKSPKRRKHKSKSHKSSNSRKHKRDEKEAEERRSKKALKLLSIKSALKEKNIRAIIHEHQAFLESDFLSAKDKAEIEQFLNDPLKRPGHIISEMLDKLDKKTKNELEKNRVVFGDSVGLVVSALMDHLYDLTDNINSVTAEVKEALAVSLVATYPLMAQEPLLPDEKPWSWLYDRKHNKGKLANYHATKQRQLDNEERVRGGGKKSKRSKASCPAPVPYAHWTDITLSQEAQFLRLLNCDERNKNAVEESATKTFEERKRIIETNRCSVETLLQAFPHLKSYNGAMIELDFEMKFGKVTTNLFKRNYNALVPKILGLADSDPETYPKDQWKIFKDSTLNSLIILSMYLPKGKRVYPWEETMNPKADIKDLVHVAKVGCNIEEEVRKKRIDSNCFVQPYILAIGTEEKLDSFILVLGDSHMVVLPSRTEPVVAVDLLIKSFFVLHTHYCLGWKNVMRFLACNVFKLPPDSNRQSTFLAQYRTLLGIQ